MFTISFKKFKFISFVSQTDSLHVTEHLTLFVQFTSVNLIMQVKISFKVITN